MSKRKRQERLVPDPRFGAVRIRALSKGQIKAAGQEVAAVDIEARIAEMRADGYDEATDPMAHLDLRERVRTSLLTALVLRHGLIAPELRNRLLSSTDSEDAEAAMRLAEKVLNLSGVQA